MRKHKGKLLLLLAISLLGAAILIRVCFFPPGMAGSNLIDHATKVADVQGVQSFVWVTSNTFLLVTGTGPTPQGRRMVWSGYLELIDAQTGRRTRLDALSNRIKQHADLYYPSFGPLNFMPSPDGQWLLWQNPLASREKQSISARVDGSGYHEWPADDSHEWLDGHRWISYFYTKRAVGSPKFVPTENYMPTHLVIHDVAQPDADRTLPFSSDEAQAIYHRSEKEPANYRGPILYAAPTDAVNSPLTLKIYQRSTGNSSIKFEQTDTVTFPAETQIMDDIPNEQQTRIELLVSETGIPAYVSLLRRFFPAYSYKARPIERLCVYRGDTRELVEIGRVYKTSTTTPEIVNAAWLPDGKHIQFLYKNAVYRVTTD